MCHGKKRIEIRMRGDPSNLFEDESLKDRLSNLMIINGIFLLQSLLQDLRY